MNLLRHFRSRTSCKKNKHASNPAKAKRNEQNPSCTRPDLAFLTHHLPRSPDVALAVHTFSEAEVKNGKGDWNPRRSFSEAIDVAICFCKNCLYYTLKKVVALCGKS